MIYAGGRASSAASSASAWILSEGGPSRTFSLRYIWNLSADALGMTATACSFLQSCAVIAVPSASTSSWLRDSARMRSRLNMLAVSSAISSMAFELINLKSIQAVGNAP